MNAVEIDVSKGKSMVAALRPMGEVACCHKSFPIPVSIWSRWPIPSLR